MFSSCSQSPCMSHETCTDSTRRTHSYSCCSMLSNGHQCKYILCLFLPTLRRFKRLTSDFVLLVCTHHTNVRNWKEIIPFTFSMLLFLVFIVGVWCSLHYLIKKLFTVCINIGILKSSWIPKQDQKWLNNYPFFDLQPPQTRHGSLSPDVVSWWASHLDPLAQTRFPWS